MATLGNSLARTIKEQIRDKIDALTSVAEVFTFIKMPFNKWPVVFITYGTMEGEFWSTSENQRVYSFRTYILVPIGKTPNDVTDDRMQFAEEAVGQVVEEIIDALDSDYELGQYNANVNFVRALDVSYGETDYEGGYAKSAELTIEVHTLYSV